MQPNPPIDSKLLELLVCPVTRGRLIYDATRSELISRGAKLAYPIRDGVPVMLEDEARKLNDNDLAATQDPARHHFQPD